MMLPRVVVAVFLLLLLSWQQPATEAFSLRSKRQRRAAMVQPIFLPPLSVSTSAEINSINNNNNMIVNGGVEQLIEQQPAAISTDEEGKLGPISRRVVKLGMLSFILGMCIALPLSLLPNHLLWRLNIIDRIQKEKNALNIGQFCCRYMLLLFPFCRVKVTTDNHPNTEQTPCVWVCNHTSMLDVFLLMAADHKLRGKKKRPIKIVYWKNLEENPVTKIMFRECGFIPVAMAANKPGEANDYDKKSFKTLLVETKRAFNEGFDIGILPEGQLNPTPEKGLLPVFSGAYTLAKLSRRPIHMMALHGIQRLWHPHEEIGMTPSHNVVHMRCYPMNGRVYGGPEEFVKTFSTVVGYFGQHGRDVENLDDWLDGGVWESEMAKRKEEEEAAKKKEEEQELQE